MAKNGKKGFFGEFKAFITRGNVLDMAVGVIVGGAFTAIVTALTSNILQPVINWILAAIFGGDKEALAAAITILKPAYNPDTGLLDLSLSIYINWGAFISAIINFVLIAFVLFCIVKAINTMNESKEKMKNNPELNKKKEIVRLRKEEGLSKKDAIAKYEANLKAEAEKKAEDERLAKEAEEAAKKAEEEKLTANTRLLEEIRDLLKNK